MRKLFFDYYPLPAIGDKIVAATEKAKPAEVPWRPSGTPGMRVREVNGKMETDGSPLDSDAKSPERSRDPPYLPEGFESFEYHSAGGQTTKLTRTKPAITPAAAESMVHGAMLVPDGATHKKVDLNGETQTYLKRGADGMLYKFGATGWYRTSIGFDSVNWNSRYLVALAPAATEWQGPPAEPAAAEAVPTNLDIEYEQGRAYERNHGGWRALYEEWGITCASRQVPLERRAEFIRRLKALK